MIPSIAPARRDGSLMVAWQVGGRPALVVGGGPVATGRARALVDAGADVLVVATRAGAELRARAARGELILHLRPFAPADLAGAEVVCVAIDDPALSASIAETCRARRVPVNVADDPSRCDFYFPAVHRDGPLQVAVGTGGAAPGTAARLRDRVAVALAGAGAEVARVAELRRALRRREPDARARAAALAREPLRLAEGTVTIAGSGPGHPDLLTVAARRALGDAEVVVADALVSPEILDLCPGEVVVARRHGGDAPGEQADVERRVIDAALAGRRVVRLKIGDPGLFGRLAEEIAAYQEAGLEVRVLPGVSSLASVGPLTARGVADRVQVGAGRSAGGGVPQPPDWRPGTTYAFLMADRALAALAAELLRAGFPADTAVVAVSRASLRDESRWSGRLADLGEAEVPGPAVVLVGGTARLHGEPRAHRRAFPGLAQ